MSIVNTSKTATKRGAQVIVVRNILARILGDDKHIDRRNSKHGQQTSKETHGVTDSHSKLGDIKSFQSFDLDSVEFMNK